ncbi:ankyrin [Daldinia loculata]|nr:ankyrin [Daldinia loculata]
MSFALGDLPAELVEDVGKHLDDGELSSLSRTCRDLHKLLIKILYSRHQLNHELMYYSVERGNISVVRYLLEAGASPNLTISSGQNRLSVRVLPLNSLGLCTWMKSDKVQPGQPEQPGQPGQPRVRPLPYYWTLLHVAASMGRDDIVNLLLQHKAKTDIASRGCCDCLLPNKALTSEARHYVTPVWMPLHTAICHGHESTARLLISHGASTGVSPDCYRITALHTACFSNNVPIIRFLLNERHQTDINVQDGKGYTPMAYAYFTNSWRSIDFLVNAGASLNVNLGSYSLIEHACLRSWFYDALRLINLGVDLAKSCAVEHEATDAVSELLFRCCQIGESLRFEPRWHTRLSHGREFDQEQFRTSVIRALIKAGANIEVRCLEFKPDRRDRVITPLMLASKYSLNEVVEILLAAGADTEAMDGDGNTALMKVCGSGETRVHRPEEARLRTVTTLLTHKPQSFDNIGRALRTALGSCRNMQIVKLLIKHAKPGTLDDEDSFKLLGDAMSQPNHDVADLLMESGLREPTSAEIDSIIDSIIDNSEEEAENDMAMKYLSRFPQSYDLLRDPNRLLNCIKKGHDDYAEFMIRLEMPANPEFFLVEACGIGNFAIAQMLLKRGADPNQCSGTDLPLVKAILGNHYSVVGLLLDHGAIVCHRGFDALDFAIVRGRTEIIRKIHTHPSYQATRTKRTAYLENACCASLAAFGDTSVLRLVLKSANPNVVLPTATVTPLHLCIARGHDSAILVLLHAEADIHMHLGPDDHRSASAINSFWGTTPLEWAISNSPRHRVGILLDRLIPVSLSNLWRPRQEMLQLRYIRAACRRHDPEVIELLLHHELPLQLRDDKGNSFLSIFCQTIESIWPLEDPNQPADLTGEKSAKCVIVLLKGGADPQQKNNEGVSALDHIRRMMTYEGPSHFHQEVAKAWNRELILDDEGIRERR